MLSPQVARANPCFAEVRLSAWVSPSLPHTGRAARHGLHLLVWNGQEGSSHFSSPEEPPGWGGVSCSCSAALLRRLACPGQQASGEEARGMAV